MLSSMNLSTVVASYNTREVTRQCLNSIFDNTIGIEHEVIVIDNSSSDGSVEMIREHFPQVRLICNDRNVGFAAAQNQGILASTGEYILALNSDVLLVDNALAASVKWLDSRPADTGVMGPLILNSDGTIAPSARRVTISRTMVMLSLINRHFNFKQYLPEDLMRHRLSKVLGRLHDNYAAHDHVRKVEYVDGMCVFFRRATLLDVGLFDEQFFFDYEILDLCNRIRQKGWKIEFYPGAHVIHLGHTSRRKVSRTLVYTHESELRYFAKYNVRDMEYLRCVSTVVVGLKKVLTRGQAAAASNHLYDEILTFAKDFSAHEAQDAQRIPRLRA